MTPSELSWTQGFVFLFLGTLINGVFWLCDRSRHTKRGEREVELQGIQIGTDTGTHSFEGERSSELVSLLRGGDDEGGSPSNDAPEAPPVTKKSRGVDVVPQTEPRMLRRRARGSDDVGDPATPRVSSTAAGLPRPPRRRFVPKSLPHDEGIPIPQVDPIQAETSQGLRRRQRADPLHVKKFVLSEVQHLAAFYYDK